MKIHQKVILIVTASILVTALPGITILYGYAQRSILASESLELERSTAQIAKSVEQHFSESKPKLSSLAYILEKELAKPIQSNEIKDFNVIMEKSLDGVWRNRKSSYEGNYEAGIFLPTNAHEGDKQKIQHLRIKRVMDTFGAAVNGTLENVWYLSLDRSEIIFDRALPNFVFQQKSDNNYTQTPWVTYASPQLNPERGIKFTPPLFDPVPKVWMVSAVYPLDVNGQWIGSVGEDMPLTGVLESMFSNSQRFSGTQNLLLDAQGNYVLAGPWQKQLESGSVTFHPDLTSNPKLDSLLKSQLSNSPHFLGDDVMLQGRRYMAIGTQLNPLGWRYFRLVPVDEVLAHSQLLLYTMGIMLVLLTILVGGIIGVAISSGVVSRIKHLSDAMKAYAADHSHRVNDKMGHDDEISEAARVFNNMANDIDLGISERKIAETALIVERQRLSSIIEGTHVGTWEWNVQTGETIFNNYWANIIGYELSELEPTSIETWMKFVHPDDAKISEELLEKHFSGELTYYECEARMRHKDGHWVWVLDRGKVAIWTSNGKPILMSGTHQDITERKLSENSLRIAATAFESQEGMLVTDAYGNILRVNAAFTEITGYTSGEAIGQTPRLLSSGRHDKAFYESMWIHLNETGAWSGEIWNRRKNGEVYPEHLTITAVKEEGGIVTNYVATLTDITMSKAASDEIKNLAFYDPLTRLPNRRLLIDRLEHALITNVRSGTHGALLFIDLDHFKTLNDTLGHNIGDLLLKQVANRLTSCVREGDTVSRLGGDEFVVLLEGLSEHLFDAAAQTELIGNKILTALNQPYKLSTYQHHSTSSIGATLFDKNQINEENLLKQADIAMYEAKKAGRNALHFFDPVMQDKINNRAEMERDLRKALEHNEFQLYYQVQVDSENHALGAEALIRWLHPKRGMVSPFHFIPLAEETGLILPIGLWVLETACAQLKSWNQHAQTSNLTISINVSAKQFNQSDFVMQVHSIVQKYAINPMLLKLELTESMLIDHIDNIIITMVALQAIGVRFELDDFGTGYSSLQYLKKLPLYQLKVDQSFVRDIASDISDQAIVQTIVAMAKSLNLEVIAEGVETEQQLIHLSNYGCNHFQGYLFGRPVPLDEFEAALEI